MKNYQCMQLYTEVIWRLQLHNNCVFTYSKMRRQVERRVANCSVEASSFQSDSPLNTETHLLSTYTHSQDNRCKASSSVEVFLRIFVMYKTMTSVPFPLEESKAAIGSISSISHYWYNCIEPFTQVTSLTEM